jgi:N-acetylglucosamine kinase-like BadF-type ATPase
MYYCGWDGGGSKTRVCTIKEQGSPSISGTFGPLNPNGTSLDIIENTIRNCINFMCTLPGGLDDCGGLVVGLAGIDNRDAVKMVEDMIRKYGYNGNLRLMGDQEIALAGAINGPGAILIAGTGSVCFGRDAKENLFQAGGYGHLIDDEGSGYAISRDILIAVIRAFDGRGPETCLTEAVFQHLQVNEISDLITWLYARETSKKQVASLAPLLLPALEQGDMVAKTIAKKAAFNLAALVITVLKKANMQTGEVALMGSILTHYDYVREQTINIIQKSLPNICLVSPRYEPALGAANLAQKFYHK